MKLAMIAASLALAGSAQARTATEKYNLQEQCGTQAAETFRKYWGIGISETNTGQIIGKYENHYNY